MVARTNSEPSTRFGTPAPWRADAESDPHGLQGPARRFHDLESAGWKFLKGALSQQPVFGSIHDTPTMQPRRNPQGGFLKGGVLKGGAPL